MQECALMFLLMHVANAPHVHPDQMILAVMVTLGLLGGSWMWQRRRS